jgi:hypothetical protein
MKYVPSDWSCGEHLRNFKTKTAWLSHLRSHEECGKNDTTKKDKNKIIGS